MQTPTDKAEKTGTGSPARKVALAPGLYFVSTPIGTARDITLRALDTLLSADVLAAEDTRTARRLLELHGVPLGDRPLMAYHDHNGARARPGLMRHLAAGASVAYMSEAGTPLVADPGFQLAREAAGAGHIVTAAPGASAAIMALTVSGLPSDRFLFAGFPPAQAGARRRFLDELEPLGATVILYESPKRIYRLLAELCEHWQDTRQAALCRELTKRFEEVRRGTLAELRDGLAEAGVKGEVVLVIAPGMARAAAPEDVDAALRAALATSRVKEAAASVAAAMGLPRRGLYQRALALKAEDRMTGTGKDDS